MTEQLVTQRMTALSERWEQRGDTRHIFLRCYAAMTHKMLLAIDAQRFADSQWVSDLLNHFAGYYFDALETYERYRDHCEVNRVIAETIDEVQDTIVEQYVTSMDVIDMALGPVDGWMISRLITGWRNHAWEQAVQLAGTSNPATREALRQYVETTTLARARRMLGDLP